YFTGRSRSAATRPWSRRVTPRLGRLRCRSSSLVARAPPPTSRGPPRHTSHSGGSAAAPLHWSLALRRQTPVVPPRHTSPRAAPLPLLFTGRSRSAANVPWSTASHLAFGRLRCRSSSLVARAPPPNARGPAASHLASGGSA